MGKPLPSIQVILKKEISDAKGSKVRKQIKERTGIETGAILSSKLFSINHSLSKKQLSRFAQNCLQDKVTDEVFVNQIHFPKNYKSFIAISKLAGVTDDEGISAQTALADLLNADIDLCVQSIFTQELFFLQEKLNEENLKQIANKVLGNPLINHFQYGTSKNPNDFIPFVPTVKMEVDTSNQFIDLDLADDALIKLSKEKVLALNLAEMKAIQAHYKSEAVVAHRKKLNLPAQASECELEILAQTWSEHCKHKEFNAIIHYENKETGESKTINSLFKTYIKGSTDKVKENLQAKNNDFLVKVFSDNAGVVRVNDQYLYVWKVETHNSPSALDPYGGAITGILGNNRDPLGTGIGGAKLLFNTNVLCFGPPNYDKKLLKGQLHPAQIMEGVRHGIEDGGNKSGIPTVNGSIVFDERYSGKPLVYCGTGALLPHQYLNKNTWGKTIDAGDLILMAGGRVGKDGIHGATFSSIEIDEHSPQSAVQIGSPITQKKLNDFLVKACNLGLIKSSTDNGAGGLSSSIGELATLTNGAVVNLEKVPLKYSGLQPWEIFISESQERMTLVVEAIQLNILELLAKEMEVELSVVGKFTNNGFLRVQYNEQIVADVSMHFLHEGVPQKTMLAEWIKPNISEPNFNVAFDCNEILLKLMGSLNICSRESVIRQYDHEVKGKSIVKPLMGSQGKAPQDAAVMRLDFNSYEGIAISNGILPRYGDIDAYQMSAGAFDEAMRQIISVGGQLPNTKEGDEIFWSVNDNFCVPDSVFHPQDNPDGKIKLAKLVQMCEALYDMATYFDIPMTSGKDSMKNDFKAEGVKISIPPTILYSMTAKMPDIRKSITSDFKMVGDLVYQLGTTYDELGASEFYKLFGHLGANVPLVRKEDAKRLYKKIMEVNELALIESSHDLSDGGLATALVESCFGQNFGLNISLDNFKGLTLQAILFSESHSRFVVSIKAENKASFEAFFQEQATFLGTVTDSGKIEIGMNGYKLVHLPTTQLLEAWNNGLNSHKVKRDNGNS